MHFAEVSHNESIAFIDAIYGVDRTTQVLFIEACTGGIDYVLRNSRLVAVEEYVGNSGTLKCIYALIPSDVKTFICGSAFVNKRDG